MSANDNQLISTNISVEKDFKEEIHSIFLKAQGLVNADPNLALSYINQIIELSKTHNYPHGLGKADLLRSAYYWFLGKIEESFAANQSAQDCFEKYNDPLHKSIAVRLLGMIYSGIGDYDQCLELYYKALEIQEQISDKRQLAITYNNIASAQMKMGVVDEGLISYKKAFAILDELAQNDSQTLTVKTMLCTNIGQALADKQDYGQSLHYHKLALQWCEMLDKNSRLIAQTYYHISSYYMGVDDYDNALIYLFKALDIVEKIEDKVLQGDCYMLIAKCFSFKSDFKQALAYAIKQRNILEGDNNNDFVSRDVLNNHRIFACIYERMKDYGRASYHYKTILELNEKIQIQDKVAQVRNKNIHHQLEQQKSKLVESNNDLKMFASIASHDMRAPLRTIASFMTLLAKKNESKFDDKDREYLSFAVNGARHLENMIEDLLAYSKLDKDLGAPSLVDLNKTAETIEQILKVYITERNAVLSIGKLPHIMGHSNLITQLIQNIVNNGLKYNKSATPTVSVSDVSNDNEIIIAIADNGIGIPEDLREKAFKMFSRLHTASEFEGSGIGLATCKKIMDFYRGKIRVEHGIEGGSIFYLSFPNKRQPGAVRASQN